ncbi:integrin alpha [Marinicella meishanensis]|uniref:integrin alpha n=1 Tax=Marinicella meishanensis TaxID=2873263 RepID=UPI001CBB3C63|nr:integrin alpha [Marinicella sp. NBU2979]
MKKNHSLIYLFLIINTRLVCAQFNQVVDLSHINGENGFIINGEQAYDFAKGKSAGDINNDGIDDLIIGASGSDVSFTNAGAAYVVYGSQSGFPTNYSLSDINGNNGFIMYGNNPGECFGNSVSGGIDVNNDGIDDMIVSAFECAFDGNNFVGSSYVIFGRDGNFPAEVDVSALNGTNGFVIRGISFTDRAGFAVKLIDDFNGDGIGEIMVTTPDTDINGFNSGSVYMLFGNDTGFPAILNLASLNGTNGFAVHGKLVDDNLGEYVSAGDINNDGLSDLIISGKEPYNFLTNTFGTTYVIYGNDQNTAGVFDLNSIDGLNGFSIIGINDIGSTDRLDWRISSDAIDMNADGIDDLIISYPQASEIESKAGVTYVVYGSTQTIPTEFDLNSIDGTNGFVIKGSREFERLGFHQSPAGDINHDGFGDLLLSSYQFTGSNESIITSYVIFADPSGFAVNFDPETLDGNNGFKIKSIDGSFDYTIPVNLSNAGDINADGVDDLMTANYQGVAGTSVNYIVYGRGDLIYQNGFE